LLISALISFGLAFYNPPADPQSTSKPSDEKKETVSGMIEAGAILVSVVVVVLVTALNDWSKEKQFRGLQSKVETAHKVSLHTLYARTIIDTKSLAFCSSP
jgi:hypothetical protein